MVGVFLFFEKIFVRSFAIVFFSFRRPYRLRNEVFSIHALLQPHLILKVLLLRPLWILRSDRRTYIKCSVIYDKKKKKKDGRVAIYLFGFANIWRWSFSKHVTLNANTKLIAKPACFSCTHVRYNVVRSIGLFVIIRTIIVRDVCGPSDVCAPRRSSFHV